MSHVFPNLGRWCLGLSLGLFGLVSSALAEGFTLTGTGGTSVSFTVTRPTGQVTCQWTGGSFQDFNGLRYEVDFGSPYDPGSSLATANTQIKVSVVKGGVVQSTNTVTVTLASQTASLSPNGGAAALAANQTFNGVATGAQAGNAYNISIISGTGGASINASTGVYTVTPSAAGLLTYKVWISAGGGYERSADAQASIAVTASKQVKVTIPANKGKYPVTYKLYQDGVEIGQAVQNPPHSEGR